MSEPPQPPAPTPNPTPAPPREPPPVARGPRRRRWQVGLQTVFLLVAAIAVWVAYFNNRRHNQMLEARIRSVIPLAHELEVADPAKMAIVKLEPYWMNDNRWDVHLPPGTYRLCLATRQIAQAGLAPVAAATPITAGRHQVGFDRQQNDDKTWRVSVTCDGREVLTVTEPSDWDESGSSSSESRYAVTEQQPPTEPAVLHRSRFNRYDPKTRRSRTIPGPCEGILIWIEPAQVGGGKP